MEKSDNKKHKKKRWGKRNISLWFIILVVVVIILLLNVEEENYVKSENVDKQATIKDLKQNSENYIGQKIIISGELHRRGLGYSIDSSDGYWVWVGSDTYGSGCIEKQRDYKFNSKKYTATGIWTEPEQCNARCIGYDHKYKLECLTPIY